MGMLSDRIGRGRGSMRGDGMTGAPKGVPPMEVLIYVASEEGIHQVSADGEVQWEVSMADGASKRIVADPDKNVYVLENDDNFYVSKLDENGDKHWQFAKSNNSWQTVEIATDSDGFTYYASGENAFEVVKIDPDGHEVTDGEWPIYNQPPWAHSQSIGDVDSGGNVYISEDETSSEATGLHKIDPNGNRIANGSWPITDHGDFNVVSMAVGIDGFIFSGSTEAIRKHNVDDGSEVTAGRWPIVGWDDQIDPDANTNGPVVMATNNSGSVYIGAAMDNWGYGAVAKIAPDGTMVWHEKLDGGIWSMAVDPDGNVYISEDENSSLVYKFDSDGNEITTNGWPFDTKDDYVQSISIVPGRLGAFPDHW